MKQIDISTEKYPNTFTMVDDADFIELNRHKWHPKATKNGKLRVERMGRVDGKQVSLKMHIVIMGHVHGKEIDHRTGDTLDNQRSNLRHCTHKENMQNRQVNKSNVSGYRGVSWMKANNKWSVRIGTHPHRKRHGMFTCLIKAAKTYDSLAREMYGEFARLNFPDIL